MERSEGQVVERTAVGERARRRRARMVDSWRVGMRKGVGGEGDKEDVSWKWIEEGWSGWGAESDD